MRPLLSLEGFRQYRRFRESNRENRRYTEPFVPCVGESYGKIPKIVFSGVAIWEPKLAAYDCEDEVAWERSSYFTRTFLRDVGRGQVSSAFWRAFDAVTNELSGDGYSLETRADACVWTNISKLGEEDRLAPRDVARELRALDAKQLRAEMIELEPDWFVCLSGDARQSTGYDVWGSLESIPLTSKRTAQTEIRRLPNGGVLYWSMHPNYKPAEWLTGVLFDLKELRDMALHV